MPLPMRDPDGNDVQLVPRDKFDQIEIQIGVTKEIDFEEFYGDVLQAERFGPGRYKLGNTSHQLQRTIPRRYARPEITGRQRGGNVGVDACRRDALYHGAGAGL